MSRFPTLQLIAVECGVSHSTVWRALKEKQSIHPVTAQRIRKVAEKIGYPSGARGTELNPEASRGGSGSASIVIPYNKESLTEDSDRIFWDFVEGAAHVADTGRHKVQMMGFRNTEEEFPCIRRLVEEEHVAGILHTGGFNPETINYLLKKKIPFSSFVPDIRRREQGLTAIVYSDHIQGYLDGWRHLIEGGHRKVGFVDKAPGSIHLIEECRAAAQLIPQPPELLPGVRLENLSDYEEIWKTLCTAWGQPEAGGWPDAIFCSHDMIAHRVMITLRKHGMEIPRDMSVVGFGDSQVAAISDPPITTIHNPRRAMGAAALQMLENLIAKRPRSGAAMMQMLPMSLTVRESTRKRKEATAAG